MYTLHMAKDKGRNLSYIYRFFKLLPDSWGLGYTHQKSRSIVDIWKLKYGGGIRQFCFVKEENHIAGQENNFGNSVNCEGEAEPECG